MWGKIRAEAPVIPFRILPSRHPRLPLLAAYFQRFRFPPVVRGPPPGFVGALWEPCGRIMDAL